VAALKKYVDAGGILFTDPCGGSPEVAQSIRQNVLARAFPDKEAIVLPTNESLVAGGSPGMVSLIKPAIRPYVFTRLGDKYTRPSMIESGHGAAIVSDLDITSGLLGTSTYGIAGYEPKYASSFVTNLILWAINERGGAPQWSTTRPAEK